jgi:hypothetical protein
MIGDLAATPLTSSSVSLTWTSTGDDGTMGRAAAYQLRYAKTNITNETDFLAAKAVAAPIPQAAGLMETVTANALDAGTNYFFAVRAVDEAGNVGPLSNIAEVATKPRAAVLVSEVATANTSTDGTDFVELVVTKAGWAQGIDIRQISGSLLQLGAFDVALGDRIVVHATGLPGPTGFAQEDAAKSKTASTETFAEATAWDLYSASTSITATDNLVTVVDAGITIDTVALSNRDGDAAAASMTAFAAAKLDGSWTFSVAPVDGTNDCQIQRESVALSTSTTTCGGFPTGSASGVSLQRNGTTDTNGKADWYVAAQTRGLANAAIPAPNVLGAIASSATAVSVTFDQELAPAFVTPAAFTIPALAVSTSTLAENVVTLGTDPQADGAGYAIAIGAAVTNLQGVALATAQTRFCGYSMLGALLTMSEVNANLPGGTDLVELSVVRGGALAGFQLRANPTAAGASGTLLATLPSICAATGDVVVVHMTPGVDVGTSSETAAIDEFPHGTYAANYDTAWDVRGGNNNIAFTSAVVALRDPSGADVEAVAFSDMSGASSATYLSTLAFVQGAALWLPADCGGVACTDATTPTAKGIAASWVGLDTTPSGNSVARHASSMQATDWSVGASSFGLPNP